MLCGLALRAIFKDGSHNLGGFAHTHSGKKKLKHTRVDLLNTKTNACKDIMHYTLQIAHVPYGQITLDSETGP